MAAEARKNGARRALAWRTIGWGGAAFLLLLPLVTGAPWTLSDFVIMGALFAGVGLGLELAFRRTGSGAYRAAAGIALVAAFLLFWINAAVGIIGSEDEDANMLFAGVLLIAFAGAAAARFRAAGMARAMAAAGLAQALVPPVAAIFSLAPAALVWSPPSLVLTLFFTGMWLVSAWLFRQAAA